MSAIALTGEITHTVRAPVGGRRHESRGVGGLPGAAQHDDRGDGARHSHQHRRRLLPGCLLLGARALAVAQREPPARHHFRANAARARGALPRHHGAGLEGIRRHRQDGGEHPGDDGVHPLHHLRRRLPQRCRDHHRGRPHGAPLSRPGGARHRRARWPDLQGGLPEHHRPDHRALRGGARHPLRGRDHARLRRRDPPAGAEVLQLLHRRPGPGAVARAVAGAQVVRVGGRHLHGRFQRDPPERPGGARGADRHRARRGRGAVLQPARHRGRDEGARRCAVQHRHAHGGLRLQLPPARAGHARGVRALSDLRERGAGRRCERQAAHALARGAPARRAAAVAGHPRIFSEHLPHRVSAARAGSWASPSRAGCRWGGTAT